MGNENSEDRMQTDVTDIWGGSRETVLNEFPHFIAMLPYLVRAHGFPRYGWQDKRLRHHYTDAGGLLGIISSNRLWATDIRFLNDPSEGKYLAETLLTLMSGKVSSDSILGKRIIEATRRFLAAPRERSSTFSVSFCADGDLLSQWRGYGSFGAGFSVGFDLVNNVHPQLGIFYDVCYGEERLDEVAADLIEIYARAAEKWGPHMIDSIGEQAAVLLLNLAHSFKDPSYKEERESRIIVFYKKGDDYLFPLEAPLRFRARGGDIVPYIPLSLNPMRDSTKAPKLPIKQIVMGPGVDFDKNYVSLTSLLEENGYGEVEILRSQIPFRAS